MDSNRSDGRVTHYYDDAIGEEILFRNCWLPNFRSRFVNPNWFVSNAAGGWTVLTADEFAQLKSVGISRSLYDELEKQHLILTKSNSESYFDSYRRWTTPHFRHPVHHIIVATLRCNFSCVYCHADIVPANAGKQHDLDLDTAKSIVDFALMSPAQVQSFEFQGGEALLNKRVILELIPYLQREYERRQRKLYISIQTNASTLTRELVDFLHARNVSIGTSLDGPPEVNDAQRVLNNGKSTYLKTVEQAKLYGLATLPTITKLSIPRWQEIVDAQLASGAKVIAFQPVYPINSAAKNWDKVGIEDDEFIACYSRVTDYLRTLWTDEYYPLERRFKLAVRKLTTLTDTDFADFGNPCGMVHSQIVYHTNGDIYTCDEGRDFPEFKLGNVKDSSYDEVVFGPRTRLLKSLSLPDDSECQTCAYQAVCSTCPVYERAKNGTLAAHHAGGLGCKQTKYIYDTLAKWYSEDPSLISRIAAFHGIFNA